MENNETLSDSFKRELDQAIFTSKKNRTDKEKNGRNRKTNDRTT